MAGEVSAGQEWKAPIGEGWVFRVRPIDAGKTDHGNNGFGGWDLIVDRDPPAGFPDALLLATPPYNSINQREVGTTFGIRAQDAIGWNPRSFRFLTRSEDFRAAQQLFAEMNRERRLAELENGQQTSAATTKLMELARDSSAGEFRILEARLTPGIADPAPFAQGWAIQASQTPHQFQPAVDGKSTPLGRLDWIRFSITLWLPPTWKAPASLDARRAACSE